MYENFGGYGDASNWVADGGYYPGSGDTVGLAATSPGQAGPIVGSGGTFLMGNRQAAPFGNPIAGALIVVGLVGATMLAVHHFGKGQGDFGNIKASLYNAMITGALATATIPLYKVGFKQLAVLGIPGMASASTYADAA